MEWRDTGILLAARRHGEAALILDVFTPGHGLHSGVVPGGASRKRAPLLQPGAQLDLVWRARLQDHIGTFAAEPVRSRAAQALADPLALSGLNAVCALLRATLPDRAPYPALYARTEALFDLLDQPGLWPLAYMRWERALLTELGFGLDLSACAVTGARDGLAYVSPRSGRAVTRAGAGDWADRLLPLPPVLLDQEPSADADILVALTTLGHFLDHHLAPSMGQPIPAARQAFLDRLARRAADAFPQA